MKRTIDPKHCLAIARHAHSNYQYLNLTWNEMQAFMAHELSHYNKTGGFGAISDTFLLSAHALGLD